MNKESRVGGILAHPLPRSLRMGRTSCIHVEDSTIFCLMAKAWILEKVRN